MTYCGSLGEQRSPAAEIGDETCRLSPFYKHPSESRSPPRPPTSFYHERERPTTPRHAISGKSGAGTVYGRSKLCSKHNKSRQLLPTLLPISPTALLRRLLSSEQKPCVRAIKVTSEFSASKMFGKSFPFFFFFYYLLLLQPASAALPCRRLHLAPP